MVCELCTARATHEGWIREGMDLGPSRRAGEGRRRVRGARSGVHRRPRPLSADSESVSRLNPVPRLNPGDPEPVPRLAGTRSIGASAIRAG